MHQALHIFKKDVRYLRYEAHSGAAVRRRIRRHALRAWHMASTRFLVVPEVFLVRAGAAFLIGRLVLAEAIPGDRQFWITRPYRWQSLLGAKVLFIIAFVNLPILAAQSVHPDHRRFPARRQHSRAAVVASFCCSRSCCLSSLSPRSAPPRLRSFFPN